MADKLHYNKQALVEGYRSTFGWFIPALAGSIACALAFFFWVMVYGGAHGHTPGKPFVDDFSDRITIEYKGTRLPMYGGPATPEQGKHE